MLISPNPVITLTDAKHKESTCDLDAFGRKTNSLEVVDNKVDVRNLAKGIYILKFETKKVVQSQKIIKE